MLTNGRPPMNPTSPSTPLAHAQRVDDPDQVVVAEPVQLLSDLAWKSGCAHPRTSSCMGQIAMVASLWWSVAVGRDAVEAARLAWQAAGAAAPVVHLVDVSPGDRQGP